MVEVDVFWAYGLGGSLAVAAGRQLKNEEKPFDHPIFSRVLLFLSLVWAPTGMLLLLKHPSWETMQAADSFMSMPPWLILGFGITNITQGILGYWTTWMLLRRGRTYLANLNWLVGYLGMFFILLYGWDGLGYDRFLYDRDMFGGVAWTPGAGLQPGAGWNFFTSSVAMTLYLDAIYLLPILMVMMWRWQRAGAGAAAGVMRSAGFWPFCGRYALAVFGLALGTAAVAAIVVHYTGQLLGAGSHAARFYGTGGNTTMHVVSYFVGLPFASLLLWLGVYRRGGIAERLLHWVFPPDQQPAPSPASSSGALPESAAQVQS
ncbi:MAG: hypothetical protein D6761_01785 [Candidatus Dadabacteria bacterium]|nr:MAG: hypothetical protein D6761_01785 [Candidatus Dadabacteria bacterium]